MSITRRGFIKLSSLAIAAAAVGVIGLDKLSRLAGRTYDPVSLTVEDAAGAKEFWTHFKVPMTARLAKAFARIESDGFVTPETQHELKIALCHDMATCSHEALADGIFKEIKAECRQIATAAEG